MTSKQRPSYLKPYTETDIEKIINKAMTYGRNKIPIWGLEADSRTITLYIRPKSGNDSKGNYKKDHYKITPILIRTIEKLYGCSYVTTCTEVESFGGYRTIVMFDRDPSKTDKIVLSLMNIFSDEVSKDMK